MTDLSTPGEVGAAADNLTAAYAFRDAGPAEWIVDTGGLSAVIASVDETGVNSFEYDATASSGLTAVFDGGEAFISGWLVRDTQSSVSLPADSTTRVYAGYDINAVLASGEAPSDSSNVIVGPSGDFSAEDPRAAIYRITTDASSITDVEDLRTLGKPYDYNDVSDRLIMTAAVAEFRSDVEVDNGSFTTPLSIVRDDSGGLRMSVAGDGETAFIAPYDSGSWNYDRGIEYRPTRGEWDIEGTPRMRDGIELEDVNGSPPSNPSTGQLWYDSTKEE